MPNIRKDQFVLPISNIWLQFMQKFDDPLICLHKDTTENVSEPQRVQKLSCLGVHVIFPRQQ